MTAGLCKALGGGTFLFFFLLAVASAFSKCSGFALFGFCCFFCFWLQLAFASSCSFVFLLIQFCFCLLLFAVLYHCLLLYVMFLWSLLHERQKELTFPQKREVL